MKSITLKGIERENVGKVATKALRNAGLVPCVIYGGENPIHFSVPVKDLKPLVYTADALTVDLELSSGKKIQAALQDLQFHPVSDEILHLDFVELFKDRPVTMEVPVKIEGVAPGVRAGGILTINARKLQVRALPANLPDSIQVNINKLEIGGKFMAKELINPNYTVLAPENFIVAYVKISRAAAKAAQDAAKVDAKAPKK